jgi:hypothetical protein
MAGATQFAALHRAYANQTAAERKTLNGARE